MSPAMFESINDEFHSNDNEDPNEYLRGVKLLYDNGITNVPEKYILPVSDRPISNATSTKPNQSFSTELLKLPIIDLAELQGPNRSQVIKSLSDACKSFGFFQVVNHGVSNLVIHSLMDVGRRFFELPYEARCKYMSSDLRAPVRYGTSFNQNKDGVFCWRDFLKLMCNPCTEVLCHWPDSPADFRKRAYSYSQDVKSLFVQLMDGIFESLGLKDTDGDDNVGEMLLELENGSQLMIVNCYPPCPQPELTLGMPPHSDYGFLTLLLQDDVPGLQILHQGNWVTVQPIPNSFVVNLGDHLESALREFSPYWVLWGLLWVLRLLGKDFFVVCLVMGEGEGQMDALADRLQGEVRISVSKSARGKAEEAVRWAVVLKLSNGNDFNLQGLAAVLKRAWNISKGISFTATSSNVALIKFDDEDKLNRVMEGGPWSFNGAAVMIRRWFWKSDLKQIKFDTLRIWTQIHQVPLDMLIDEVTDEIAEVAGKVQKRTNRDLEVIRRRFVRYKVEVNIHRPLLPGCYIDGWDGMPKWVSFKYERLPLFCKKCGVLDHSDGSCGAAISSKRFGVWLRAESEIFWEPEKSGNSTAVDGGNERDDSAKVVRNEFLGTASGLEKPRAIDSDVTESCAHILTLADYTENCEGAATSNLSEGEKSELLNIKMSDKGGKAGKSIALKGSTEVTFDFLKAGLFGPDMGLSNVDGMFYGGPEIGPPTNGPGIKTRMAKLKGPLPTKKKKISAQCFSLTQIFSNGLYKSVLHRVIANSNRLRTSVASLHSLPFNKTITPSRTLVKKQGKKLYKDTNFADFLEYASTQEPKEKDFLESRKL